MGHYIGTSTLSSHCNAFEDQFPVDKIYGYPLTKCVVMIVLNEQYQISSLNNARQENIDNIRLK